MVKINAMQELRKPLKKTQGLQNNKNSVNKKGKEKILTVFYKTPIRMKLQPH